MKIIGRNTARRACAATIGFFDGVHRGHRFLISKVADEAHRRNLASVLITFSNHPLTVVKDSFRPLLITTAEEKELLLSATGADMTVVLDFTPELALMTAKDFIFNVLRDQLDVKVLVIGYDHHFGHNRDESFDDYVRYGHEAGITVLKAEELTDRKSCLTVSSSIIRRLLLDGEIETANKFLGYDFFIEGIVVGGFHIGRTIGYPTANIQVLSSEKLIPGNGVYAVRVVVKPAGEQSKENSDFHRSFLGMMNIGCRPTFANGDNRTIEVHLLDFSGDIYLEHLHIDFIAFIRKEHKFESVEQLQEQLRKDEQLCRRYNNDIFPKGIEPIL